MWEERHVVRLKIAMEDSKTSRLRIDKTKVKSAIVIVGVDRAKKFGLKDHH